MRIVAYLFLLIFSLLLSLINQLHAQKEQPLEPFDQIAVAGNIDVFLVPGDSEKITLYIQGIPEKEVVVKQSKGQLRISVINGFVYKNEVVQAYVNFRQLRSIRSSAGAEVSCEKSIASDQLETRVASGGAIRLPIKVNALLANASEGGILELTGTTEKAEVGASTGGQCQLSSMVAQRAYVRTGTGGRVEIDARELLETSASLGGEIYYVTEPKEKRIKSFLGGEVQVLPLRSKPTTATEGEHH